MRFQEFRQIVAKPLLEAKGLFGRNTGDKFVHPDGRELSFVEIVAFPSPGENLKPSKLSAAAINQWQIDFTKNPDANAARKIIDKLGPAEVKQLANANINVLSQVANQELQNRRVDGKFANTQDRDEAVNTFEKNHHGTIEWVNTTNSKALAFAVAILEDNDGGHVYWGKYFEGIKHDMLGSWSNGQVPEGWSLNTKGAKKLQAGYDPQNLIKTEERFAGVENIIRTVASNSPDEVRRVFTEALKDLSQGKGDIVFPGMFDQMPALRDYFGEIMQPIALMGNVIQGQAEQAREVLAGGSQWRDCQVYWPMAMNAALCDSFMIAPNGQEIGISSKGGAGARASAKNLYDAAEKARKEGNTKLLDNAKYTVDVVKIINDSSAKQGPFRLAMQLGIKGIDEELLRETNNYINTGKADLNDISEKARLVLEPYNVQLSTKGFNAGYAITSAVAKTTSAEINKNPEFSKGALLLLNQSSIIQIYTKMGKQGNNVVLGEFTAVYPPNFEGTLKVDGSKNYYSSRIAGRLAFFFD